MDLVHVAFGHLISLSLAPPVFKGLRPLSLSFFLSLISSYLGHQYIDSWRPYRCFDLCMTGPSHCKGCDVAALGIYTVLGMFRTSSEHYSLLGQLESVASLTSLLTHTYDRLLTSVLDF